MKHFRAMLQADTVLTRHVQSEVGVVEDEIRQVREAHAELEITVRSARGKFEEAADFRRQLESQLVLGKQRLAELNAQRQPAFQKMHLLSEDSQHCRESFSFLSQAVEDEEKLFEGMQQSNKYLEKFYKGQEEEANELLLLEQEIRRDIMAESELLFQEEQHTLGLRKQIEELRRNRDAWSTSVDAARTHVATKLASPPQFERKVEQHSWAFSFSEKAAPKQESILPQAERKAEQHSWAFSYGKAPPPLTVSANPRAGSPPALLDPWSREGV